MIFNKKRKRKRNINDENVQWANTPMNIFRIIVSPSIKPLKKELKEFGNKLYNVTAPNSSEILEQEEYQTEPRKISPPHPQHKK